MAYQGFQGPRFKSESLGPSSSIYLNRKVMQSHKSKKKKSTVWVTYLTGKKSRNSWGHWTLGTLVQWTPHCRASVIVFVLSTVFLGNVTDILTRTYAYCFLSLSQIQSMTPWGSLHRSINVYYGDYCYGNWDSHDMLQWPTNYSS